MSIHRDHVIYADPTCPTSNLSAYPATQGGQSFGVISVTQDCDFAGGQFDNKGRTQSVCIKTGDELAVLAALGNTLRSVETGSADQTLVITELELHRRGKFLGLTTEQLNSLLKVFTKAPVRTDQHA